MEQNQKLTPISPAQRIQELQAFGFKLAGAWRLEPSAKGGVRFALETLQSERVVYAFVVDELVEYIGICDSVATTLTSRMSRYQNFVGAGMRPDLLRINAIGPRTFDRDPRISQVFRPSRIQSTYGAWMSNPLDGVGRVRRRPPLVMA